MPTFDLTEVRRFAADLDARMDRCENGEAMDSANLDDVLGHYATLCCEFRKRVREWGREVFAGRAAFDAQVEQVWLEEGHRLYARALETLAGEPRVEAPCCALDGKVRLQSALWELRTLLDNWTSQPSNWRGILHDCCPA